MDSLRKLIRSWSNAPFNETENEDIVKHQVIPSDTSVKQPPLSAKLHRDINLSRKVSGRKTERLAKVPNCKDGLPGLLQNDSGRFHTAIRRRATVTSLNEGVEGCTKASACHSSNYPFYPTNDASGLAVPYRRRSLHTISHSSNAPGECTYCRTSLVGVGRCLHPYWPQVAMCSNCSRTIPRCLSCERKAVSYTDQRMKVHSPIELSSNCKICGICASLRTVQTIEEAAIVKGEVLEFYRNFLSLHFNEEMMRFQQCPRAAQGRNDQKDLTISRDQLVGYCVISHDASVTHEETRATDDAPNENLACNTIRQRINSATSSIDKIPGQRLRVLPADISDLNGTDSVSYTKFGQCDMRKLNTRAGQQRVVDQISVVKGLPGALFTSNLCHEMLHAYMFLSHFFDMDPEVEEGLCNAVAVMFLNQRMQNVEDMIDNLANNDIRREVLFHELDVCEFAVRKFYRNEHPHYGGGFRKAMKCIERNGFKQTLEMVKLTGKLC